MARELARCHGSGLGTGGGSGSGGGSGGAGAGAGDVAAGAAAGCGGSGAGAGTSSAGAVFGGLGLFLLPGGRPRRLGAGAAGLGWRLGHGGRRQAPQQASGSQSPEAPEESPPPRLAPVCRWMVSPMSNSKELSSPATRFREST